MNKLHLKNGLVVDPSTQTNEIVDIWVDGEKISRTKPVGSDQEFEILDLTGKIVMPGLIDLRSHGRNLSGGGVENIESLSRAAARGGFTSLLLMPDISPVFDSPGAIRYAKECAEKNSYVNVKFAGALSDKLLGKDLAPIGSLRDAGVCVITDCPKSTQNNEIFVKGVEYASMFGLPVIEFPREESLSKNGNAHDSAVSLSMGLGGYPRMAEEIFVQRAITVSKNLDAHIHLSSISSKGSVELISDAKDRGINITADTTPHHLILTDQKISGYDTNFKTHPPLREQLDREALKSGLMDGTIDAICSAHEPFQQHHKNAEYDKAPAGVTSLETCLCALIDEFKEIQEVSSFKLAEWLSYNPAKIINSDRGTLEDGCKADFIILNLDKEWVYNNIESQSLSGNNPFQNQKFSSFVENTYVNGRLVSL